MEIKTKLKIAKIYIGVMGLGFLALIVGGIVSDWQGFIDFIVGFLWLILAAGVLAMTIWASSIINEANKQETRRFIDEQE